ncbi:MAG: MarR family transcriptional regulator [Azorhizobium sp. 32-67-21]|nr:MAG: MarR family transcriptional regulator [Rhizobiales bacterium 12-68-15]OYX90153.1 MAG: MarR family transcriptional regulator [Azorhizobium sp. 32-67-21]
MAAAGRGKEESMPLTASRDALLVDGSDAEFRALVHDMLAFASAIQEVRNRLGQLIGLSGTQYTILTAIARLTETRSELGVNQLADHLHLSGAFVTIEVNKLVAAGLVSKAVNPDDRRRVVLEVTAEAERRLKGMTRVQCPANDMLFEPLTAKDFRQLRAITSKLAGTGPRTLALIEALAPERLLAEFAPEPTAPPPQKSRRTA